MDTETSDRELSADLSGKRGKGKRENGAKKKENRKRVGRWKIENGMRKSYKMRRGPSSSSSFFFSLLKPLKFVLGLPKWEFSSGKKHFTSGKKIRKNDFTHSEKYSSQAPVQTPAAPVLKTLSFRLWNCWLSSSHLPDRQLVKQCSLSRWGWPKWSLLTSTEFQPCIIYSSSRAGPVIHNDHKFLKCLKILIIKYKWIFYLVVWRHLPPHHTRSTFVRQTTLIALPRNTDTISQPLKAIKTQPLKAWKKSIPLVFSGPIVVTMSCIDIHIRCDPWPKPSQFLQAKLLQGWESSYCYDNNICVICLNHEDFVAFLYHMPGMYKHTSIHLFVAAWIYLHAATSSWLHGDISSNLISWLLRTRSSLVMMTGSTVSMSEILSAMKWKSSVLFLESRMKFFQCFWVLLVPATRIHAPVPRFCLVSDFKLDSR